MLEKKKNANCRCSSARTRCRSIASGNGCSTCSDHYGRRGAALHVISAIDIALWDIAGKAAGRPVSDLLGGRRLEEIPVYASVVTPETPDEVRRIATRSAEAGYSALKLGWGPLGRDLADDEQLVRAAREDARPGPGSMLDGGRAYTVKRALDLLRRVEESIASTGSRRRCNPTIHGYLASPTVPTFDLARRSRRNGGAVPRARRTGSPRCPAAGSCALRRLHGGASDRVARALFGS